MTHYKQFLVKPQRFQANGAVCRAHQYCQVEESMFQNLKLLYSNTHIWIIVVHYKHFEFVVCFR